VHGGGEAVGDLIEWLLLGLLCHGRSAPLVGPGR